MSVSKLVLGTAAFAPEYAGQPGLQPHAAHLLATEAARHEIQWFDTAPTYGEAEHILGQSVAWRPNCFVATKVKPTASVSELRKSLVHSRMSLRTSVLDAVLLHNVMVADLSGPVMEELREQQAYGSIDLVGASVYEEGEALAAIVARCEIVEVPFNLIDQRMAKRVFPAALKAGVGIWVRSVWLRGWLAERVTLYPSSSAPLSNAVIDVMDRLWLDYALLPSVALRFVLSYDAVTGVVIGPRTPLELDAAIAAAERGPLGLIRRLMATSLPEYPADVCDPRRWT